MDEGSPPRIKELFQRKRKRLQVRTPRDWHVEGVNLASDKEEDFNKDNGANQLHIKEVEQSPPLVVSSLLLQSNWVAFTPGTLQTLGERGGKRMLIGHTCGTSLSPSMSSPRKLMPSLLR